MRDALSHARVVAHPRDHAHPLPQLSPTHIGRHDLAVGNHVGNHGALLRPRLHVGAEQVAGRKVDHAKLADQLGALAVPRDGWVGGEGAAPNRRVCVSYATSKGERALACMH